MKRSRAVDAVELILFYLLAAFAFGAGVMLVYFLKGGAPI